MQVHFVSSGTRWHSFRNADLLAEVWHCLEHGEICSAVTIWRRHQVMLPAFQSLKTIDSEVSSNHQKNHLQKNHCNTIEVKSSTDSTFSYANMLHFIACHCPSGAISQGLHTKKFDLVPGTSILRKTTFISTVFFGDAIWVPFFFA